MSRQRSTRWAWFFEHEGPAILLSFAWTAFCLYVVVQYGPEYDPLSRLSLDELADVATVASGIVAPIAVLWVVRSIHVQKRELASAVRAANDQAAGLAAQANISAQQLELSKTPKIELSVGTDTQPIFGSHQTPPEGAPTMQEYFNCTLRNVGEGLAESVTVAVTNHDASGAVIGGDYRTFDDSLASGEIVRNQFIRQYSGEASRYSKFEVRCRRIDGEVVVRRWKFSRQARKLSEEDA